MSRTVVALILMVTADAAFAQSSRWDDRFDDGAPNAAPRYVRPWRDPDGPGEPPSWRGRQEWRQEWRGPETSDPRQLPPNRRRPAADEDDEGPPQRGQRQAALEQPRGQKTMDGGPQPDIRPVPPQRVFFAGKQAPGTIIIETSGRQLLLVVRPGEALRYPISVGRQGFTWTGTEHISRIADWPDWHPPEQMRERDPKLPEMMTGGLRNPLGAKALYLGDTLYRIHGTNDAKSIGYASSSGCFRMLNGHVVDLANRVRTGTTVVVVERLPRDALRPVESSGYRSEDRPRTRY